MRETSVVIPKCAASQGGNRLWHASTKTTKGIRAIVCAISFAIEEMGLVGEWRILTLVWCVEMRQPAISCCSFVCSVSKGRATLNDRKTPFYSNFEFEWRKEFLCWFFAGTRSLGSHTRNKMVDGDGILTNPSSSFRNRSLLEVWRRRRGSNKRSRTKKKTTNETRASRTCDFPACNKRFAAMIFLKSKAF